MYSKVGNFPIFPVDSGWHSPVRDIGWAEAVVIEMAVMWLTMSSLHDSSIKVNCDNTSVISSFWKGHSHDSERNKSLIHVTTILPMSNLTINPYYIHSAQNKADSLSCGLAGADELHLVPHMPILEPLCAFLDPV